jgi:hypothetical protein
MSVNGTILRKKQKRAGLFPALFSGVSPFREYRKSVIIITAKHDTLPVQENQSP